MIQFRVNIIDYKGDTCERDEDSMRQKAENIREELKNGYNIDPFVNYSNGCYGPLVNIEFASLDKDIKRVFKLMRKNKVYSIRTEWREDF